jgi:hypothetical protein
MLPRTPHDRTMQRLARLLSKYDSPQGSPPPAFKTGQRVSIDKLHATGKISKVRGYDPFGGETSYDIVLDTTGNEVAWTEKHLSRTR